MIYGECLFSFWEARVWVVVIGYVDTACLHEWPPIKAPDTKVQVSFPDWQHCTCVVICYYWESKCVCADTIVKQYSVTVITHWKPWIWQNFWVGAQWLSKSLRLRWYGGLAIQLASEVGFAVPDSLKNGENIVWEKKEWQTFDTMK